MSENPVDILRASCPGEFEGAYWDQMRRHCEERVGILTIKMVLLDTPQPGNTASWTYTVCADESPPDVEGYRLKSFRDGRAVYEPEVLNHER
jgi:hypothetical protein